MATNASNDRRMIESDRVTVGDARRAGATALEGVSETPALDAALLLEKASGLGRIEQIARTAELLDDGTASRFRALLGRRRLGEPIAYIVGRKSFREIELLVDENVLIPRPETELLVELGLFAIANRPGNLRVLDVGTGSGSIALALASEMPGERLRHVEVVASDISQRALEVARKNRDALGLEHVVSLVQSDLLDSVRGEFDLILANLPYLREDQCHPSIEREPSLALFAGSDGLDIYRRFFVQASERLRSRGVMACEIDPSQSVMMLKLARQHFGAATVLKDLARRDRIILAGGVDIVRTVDDTWSYGA